MRCGRSSPASAGAGGAAVRMGMGLLFALLTPLVAALAGPTTEPSPSTRPARPARRFHATTTPRTRPTLFLVGDSTVKNGTRGQTGWGEKLAPYFDPARIAVENRALGGRSSRTYQTEGHWSRLLQQARPGDFVLIQLGHNDSGPLGDPIRARGTLRGSGDETRVVNNPITHRKETVHTYGWYLRKYITDARERGLTPIICSPVPRCPRRPVAPGEVERSGYVAWSAEAAAVEKAPFINLNQIVLSRYAHLWPAQVKDLYFTPADNTHTSPAGAALNAQCVVQGIRNLKDCSLNQHLLPPTATTRPAFPSPPPRQRG